jgi:colanic acid/amylovoran biosynthesis glycosyltransferase
MSPQPIALERCDTFVGRTMNWLYDHLRAIPRYQPLVLCDQLANRVEFPELEAWEIPRDRIGWRVWRRVMGDRLYPPFAARLRRVQPRVLHTHFGYVAVGDALIQRALECPWVVGFYGADVYELGNVKEWQSRYEPVFANAALILALGPAMAAALARLGCPPDKIAVHALGVDTASLPRHPRILRAGEDLQLLFAGTFREKKGVEYVVEAARILHARGVPLKLHLVGDAAGKTGDEDTKAAIFRAITSGGLEDVVTHHSWLPYQEMLALALRCHVFVAPSVTARDGDSEGTPFVIQQMMATDMPVVTTRHSDIPFLFGDLASQLVPERDATALADRLLQYAAEPDCLISNGAALGAQMRQHFDVRVRAEQLAALYDRVA